MNTTNHQSSAFYLSKSKETDLTLAMWAFAIAGLIELSQWIINLPQWITLPVYAMAWWGVSIVARQNQSKWLKRLLWWVAWANLLAFALYFIDLSWAVLIQRLSNWLLMLSCLGYLGRIRKLNQWAILGGVVVFVKLFPTLFNSFYWLNIPYVALIVVSLQTIFFCKLIDVALNKQ